MQDHGCYHKVYFVEREKQKGGPEHSVWGPLTMEDFVCGSAQQVITVLEFRKIKTTLRKQL